MQLYLHVTSCCVIVNAGHTPVSVTMQRTTSTEISLQIHSINNIPLIQQRNLSDYATLVYHEQLTSTHLVIVCVITTIVS